MSRALILLIGIVPSAFALSEAEFHSRAAILERQQAETDALMRRFGANAGFSDYAIGQSRQSDKSEARPLFRIHGSLSSAHIPTGGLLYGRLLNRLVVGPDGSPVLILLDFNQGFLSGLRIMGTARQAGTEGRITLELNKILLRNGKAIAMQGTGLDTAGAYGLEAQVFSGKALAVAGAMASSLIAGVAASQQTQNVNAFGFATAQPTGRNAILQGVAQTAADQSKRLIDEATAEKPILVVESQTSVVVLVQEEVRL